METAESSYRDVIRSIEEKLLRFLRTFEAVQEEILLPRINEAQDRLRAVANDVFPQLTREMVAIVPPEPSKDFHVKLSRAIAHCSDAGTVFLKGTGRDFPQAFLRSRDVWCRGLYLLYEIHSQLPTLQPYWLTSAAWPLHAALEKKTSKNEVPVGFIHQPRTEAHSEYSLYVPEQYTTQKTWPLIVCLHGGYGHGNEYIWTWLRPAKSSGYLLLSPKSAGPTWSILNPPVDIRSIQGMLAEVGNTYVVDGKRIYLTGLSDGGTFSYIFGLANAEMFAGIAPIAAEFHPMIDPLLRQGKGKETPLLVVHGGQDPIFDVESTREACVLFKRLGYNLTYQELPNWGHAYSYKVNEQIVLPWFASLTKSGSLRA